MMLFSEGESSLLTEAVDRAVEDGDVTTLTKLLEENPTIPIVPLLSRAITLVDIHFSDDARLSVIEELMQHSFVATDDLLKTAISLKERCSPGFGFPSESHIEKTCRRQALIDQLRDTPRSPPMLDDLLPARAAERAREAKLVRRQFNFIQQ